MDLLNFNMKTIFSQKHKLRNSQTELYGGQLVRPFECPERMDYIISSIEDKKVGEISEPIVLPEGIIIFTVRDKRKSNKVVDLESIRNSLILAERNKILNMYSLSHYESLTRKIAVNYN